ncbi:MAG: hypothetical protein K0R54_137 [Clostridiaceae bacterium]|nr:hypothetical protein [Clostridiaceae bacterium]
MLKFIKKNKNLKEYMKYENGKIVTVEIEKKEVSKKVIDKETDFFDNKDDIKIGTIQNKLKSLKLNKEQLTIKNFKELINSKLLKTLALLLIILFFIYSVCDLYKTFSTDSYPQQDTPNNNNEITEPVDTKDVEKEIIIDTEPEVIESPFKKALTIVNTVNQLSVLELNIEVSKIESYIDKKTNRVALQNTLESSINSKEKLYIYLVTSKEIFENENFIAFYESTENRLLNSIKMSKDISNMLNENSDKKSIKDKMEFYINQELECVLAQNKELIEVLKARNINYTINEDLNQISYEIK